MFARLSRGWSMAKASFAVLKQYPKLAILPVMSGTIFLIIAGAILASLMPQLGSAHFGSNSIWKWLGSDNGPGILFYVAAFGVLFVMTAVAIFFNVALIHCALRALAGEEPSIRGGLKAAVALLPQILGWAFVATTIGFMLNMITDTLKELSRLPRRSAGRPARVLLGRHHLLRRAGAGDREGRADHGGQALGGDPARQVGRVARRRSPHRPARHPVLPALGAGVCRRRRDGAAARARRRWSGSA